MTGWPGRVALAAAALAALAACRPEEQGRPLTYEKGVYLGAADTELDDQTLSSLRERAIRQTGLDGGAYDPMAATVGPGVRPPAPMPR